MPLLMQRAGQSVDYSVISLGTDSYVKAVDRRARRQWPLWDTAAQSEGNAAGLCFSDPAIGAGTATGDAGEFPSRQPLLAVVDYQFGMLLAADEEAG